MKIAVDLTSAHDAEVERFVLRLMRDLVVLTDAEQFLLLTSGTSHARVAHLETPRVQCLQVAWASAAPGRERRISLRRRIRLALQRWLPARLMLPLERAYVKARTPRPGPGLLTQHAVDLLFAPYTSSAFAEPRIPVVSLLHGLEVLTYPRFFAPDERAARRRRLQQAVQTAAILGCLSQFSRETVIQHLGVSPERVKVILPRVDHANAFPESGDGADALASFGLSPNEFLLYPAEFRPHHNHEMLLAALGIYRAEHPESRLRLVFVGLGPEQAIPVALRQALEAMRLEQAVVLASPSADLRRQLLESCTAVVYPSLHEELGLAVLDAMAHGAPVICGQAGCLPEVAAYAGLVIDARKPDAIARAIDRVVSDQTLREALARAGRARAEALGPPTATASDCLALFRGLTPGVPSSTLELVRPT